MAVLIFCFVILLFPSISYQKWSLAMSPSAYAVGVTNITSYCQFVFFFTNYFNNMTFEFRPNKNYDWLDVAYINESGTHILHKQSKENFISFMSFSGYFSRFDRYPYMRADATLYYNRCTVDAELDPIFRCRGSLNNGSIDTSPEKSILSIKGNIPSSLSSIRNLWPRSNTKAYYEVGDVLQLQCTGEIESINSTPSKPIRWCKKEKEQFRVLSLQDLPTSSIVYRSKDGCTLTENSVIFYHITKRDTDLEIMCETGSYHYFCGLSGLNSSVSILTSDTIKEVQKWMMSPILIHNGETWLNPQHIEVPEDEIGTTIHLLSTASVVSPNSSLTKNINWCIKKHGEKKWTKVVLQDGNDARTEATSNSSGQFKIFSEIIYHVTSLDTEIYFMCEISTTYACGTALASSNISLRIVSDKQQQNATEPPCSMAGLSVVIVLLILTVIFITICVIILCRRKKIRFFGWLIKLDISDQNQDVVETQAPRRYTNGSTTVQPRPSVGSSIRYVASPTTNGCDHNEGENRSHTNQGYEPETDEKPTDDYEEAVCSIAPKRESFYENEVLKQEREMEVYEDLNTESSQQDYDDLKF